MSDLSAMSDDELNALESKLSGSTSWNQDKPIGFNDLLEMSKFGKVGRVGKFANGGNQQLGDLMGQYGGTPGKIVGGGLKMASNVMLPKTGAEAAMLPLWALGPEEAVNAAGKGVKEGIVKSASQGMKVTAGIMEDTGRALLEHPVKVLMADTPEVAGQKIAKAASDTGLKAGMDGFSEVFGSEFHPDPAGMKNLVREKWPTKNALQSEIIQGNISPQEALSNVQAINHTLMVPKYKNPLNAQDMSILLDRKAQLVDYLKSMGAGSVIEALEGYRFAKAKEAFMNLFPQNATGGTSVLRSTLGGAAALGSEATSAYQGKKSDPIRDMAAAAAFSPIGMLGVGGGAAMLGNALAPAASAGGKLILAEALKRMSSGAISGPNRE